MRQYFLYSASVHFVLAVFAFVVLGPLTITKMPPRVYTVDFIGGSPVPVQAGGVTAVAAPAPTVPAEKPKASYPQDSNTISTGKTKKPKKVVLQAPSVLSGLPSANRKAKPVADGVTEVPVGTGVSADFPDFPYPWYITQVRMSLWNEWSSRMPSSGQITALIAFKILRNGTIKDLKTERSSGNKLFDFAATSSVQQAVPFPPLPDDYDKDELNVHVEFRVIEQK